VENESCTPVTYYGYIQACCETDGSPNGRIPWQVTFTPNPNCKAVEFNCNNVTVADILITNQGSGYNPGAVPNALISGGGGIGATATVVVGNGGIDSYNLTSVGAGMTDGSYPGTAANTVTGAGVGATFDIIVFGGVIISAIRAAFGTGYLGGDTVNFPSIPGSGTELVTVTAVNTSLIQDIVVTSPGSGFSSQPIITIDPSPGFGGFPAINGTASVVLALCPAFDAGTSCESVAIGTTLSVPVGEAFQFCYPGGLAGAPVPPVEFATAEDPLTCCFDCHSVLISQPPAADTNAFYQDCTTGQIVSVFIPKGTSVTVCARNNSFASERSDTTFAVGILCP
jgi:hypothetical protein